MTAESLMDDLFRELERVKGSIEVLRETITALREENAELKRRLAEHEKQR